MVVARKTLRYPYPRRSRASDTIATQIGVCPVSDTPPSQRHMTGRPWPGAALASPQNAVTLSRRAGNQSCQLRNSTGGVHWGEVAACRVGRRGIAFAALRSASCRDARVAPPQEGSTAGWSPHPSGGVPSPVAHPHSLREEIRLSASDRRRTAPCCQGSRKKQRSRYGRGARFQRARHDGIVPHLLSLQSQVIRPPTRFLSSESPALSYRLCPRSQGRQGSAHSD